VTKLRVDMADLTLGEMADAGELLGAPLHEVMGGVGQPRAIAAMVCMLQRRTDPGYSLEAALALRMSDLDMVNPETDPEKASAGSNGERPAVLPASGS
jgi:hypothetical protein